MKRCPRGHVQGVPLVSNSARPAIVAARTTTLATVLVCTDCDSGAAVRRDIKRVVKEAGRKRDIRVIGCGCFDICPKRGAVALIAQRDESSRCVVIDGGATIDEALVDRLVDQRVGNAVAHEHGSLREGFGLRF